MQKRLRTLALGAGAVALVATIFLGVAVAHGAGPGGMRGHGGTTLTEENGTVDGRFVTFGVDEAAAAITRLTWKGVNDTTLTLAERVSYALPAGAAANGTTGRGGYALKDDAGDVLLVRDAPHAGFHARSANGTTLTVVLPDGATVATHDAVANWSPGGATVTYATGETANLVLGRNATLAVDGQTLTVTLAADGDAGFGLVPDGFPYAAHGLGPGFGHEEHGMRGPHGDGMRGRHGMHGGARGHG